MTTPKPPECRYANETPFPIAAAVYLGGREARYTMTVAVKASFAIAPGRDLVPLETQEQFRGDEFADPADLLSELKHGNDLAMWKPGADLLLRGTCHAPGAMPVSVCEAGFRVGEWSKLVRVTGDRVWRPGLVMAGPGEPVPFTAMPLTWSRAFGGPDTPENPGGRGRRSDLLPNVEYRDRPMQRRGQVVTPAGFGPINRQWAPRRDKMGTYGKRHFELVHPRLPEDFDWTYFNEAPADQQLRGYLRGDEEVSFHHLHPQAPSWTVRLPGLRLRVFVADRDEHDAPRVREVDLNLDTLAIDADAGVLALVWRGLLAVRSEDRAEVGKFYVVKEALAQEPRPAAEHVAAMAAAPDLYGKMQKEFDVAMDAAKAKTQAILDRYGLFGHIEKALADPGLTPERLAMYPFTPDGPLPPEVDGDARAALAQAQEHYAKGMAEYKKLGSSQPAGTPAPPAPAAPMAQLAAAMAQAAAMLKANGQEMSPALKDLAAKIQASPKDPFGLGERLAALRGQGLDLDRIPAAKAMADGADIDASIAALVGPAVVMPNLSAAPAEAPPALPGSLREALGPAIAAAAGLGTVLNREVLLGVKRSGRSFAGGNWTGGDFTGMDLDGEDFTGAILMRARFAGARLAGADFTSVLAQDTDFSEAGCAGATFREADFSRARFDRADLTGASFASLSLAGASFASARMEGCGMASAGLDKSDLSGAVWRDGTADMVIFNECAMTGLDAKGARWNTVLCLNCVLDDAVFDTAILAGVMLSACRARRLRLVAAQAEGLRAFNGSDLSEAVAVGMRAEGSTWMHAVLVQADFEGAKLRRACLMDSWCEGARFRGADLTQAAMRRGRFARADFQGANLFQACLGLADLQRASLLGANCYEADFTDARTTDADLRLARLTRTSLDGQQ